MFQAHRHHLFQRLHQAGWPHACLSSLYIAAPAVLAVALLVGGAARLAWADAFRQLLHPQPSEQLLIRCPLTPPPPQFMPELLQGYDTATQITALALWLRERHSPPPRRLWIATDPEHIARATLLARIALAGRGIEIQPDPPPLPTPNERHKHVRDAWRLVLWRATGSTGGVWGVGLQLLADPRGAPLSLRLLLPRFRGSADALCGSDVLSF